MFEHTGYVKMIQSIFYLLRYLHSNPGLNNALSCTSILSMR